MVQERYTYDLRWGWECPRCAADVRVIRDDSDHYRWECPNAGCLSVGFGFTSRRRARIALREYREQQPTVYR